MRTDVIARLTAANPVPGLLGVPLQERRLRPSRRALVAAVAAAAVAVPAVSLAAGLGGLLGISNEGTTVPTAAVLPGQSELDQAMQQLQVGGSMQYLGELSGVAFYATRNAQGSFCLAIDHVGETYDKGFGCAAGADEFPSAAAEVAVYPALTQLQGVAADGVATVEALDASGNVLDSTPVVDNLFVSTKQLARGSAAYVEALDSTGAVLSRQKLPAG